MKISIIGLGSVGSAVATAISNTGLAHEIVLFDRDGVRARAAAEAGRLREYFRFWPHFHTISKSLR